MSRYYNKNISPEVLVVVAEVVIVLVLVHVAVPAAVGEEAQFVNKTL